VSDTIIEIGDEVLQKVDLAKPPDNFLRHCLESAGQTTLHLRVKNRPRRVDTGSPGTAFHDDERCI
jgi:hypothetical protein